MDGQAAMMGARRFKLQASGTDLLLHATTHQCSVADRRGGQARWCQQTGLREYRTMLQGLLRHPLPSPPYQLSPLCCRC